MAIPQAMTTTVRGASRAVKALLAAAITVGVLGGIPWGLLHYAGDPLPHSIPHLDAVKHALNSTMTPQVLLKCLSIVGWYLWLILAISFAVELVAAARRANAPHIPTLGPTQTIAAALITAIGITALLRAAPAQAAENSITPTGARVAATAPAVAGTTSLSTAHAALGGTTAATTPRESVHTVKPGESLYSIAKEDLGDGNEWPQLYKLNAGVAQADGDKLTDPDLIRPDWKIRITAPAPATASPAPHTEAPAPPAPKAPAPATAAPSTLPAPVTTSGPSTLPAPAAPHTAAPAPVTHTTPSNDDHGQGDRAKRHGGPAVSLPDGGTIGITLAVALGAALVLARRWHTRRNDPRLPVAEPPLPGALLAARRAQRALTAAMHPGASDGDVRDDELYDDLTEAHGIEDLDDDLFVVGDQEPVEGVDDWEDTEELDEFGAPTGPVLEPTVTRFAAPLSPGSISAAERDGVELPLTPTGTGLGLVGPGAAGAARAIAASVLSAGAPDRTADLARLIIPAADLAALLGVAEAELSAITHGLPELFPTTDLAAAISEAEIHALLRTRLLEEYEQPDLDALAAAHPDVEDCPPLVLMASPARALSGQIGTLMRTSAHLRITTVLLGAHPDGPTAFVEADGTATGPTVGDWSGARLWNLSATALADVLDLLARAAGDPGTGDGQPESEDWPETSPARETARTAGDGGGQEATVTILPVRAMPEQEADPAGDHTDKAKKQTVVASQTAGEDAAALAPVTMLPVRPASAPISAAADAARSGAQMRADTALAAWEQNPVRISVLGGLSITVDGQPVSGLRTSARVLAALLAVKGQAGASAEQIDAMCWPDADPEEMDRVAKWRADGLNSLRKRLAVAIGQRSPRLVLLDRATGRYRLNPALITTDIGTLAELVGAARGADDTEQRLALLTAAEPLCRGQLLDGELGDNLDWGGDYTATWADEQVAVLARLATLASTATRHDQALAALEKAAVLTEDNEALYRQMFDILAGAGRHSEIPGKLRTLEAYADSLGADVSTATREAAARAMKRQPQQGVRQDR